MGRRVLEAFVLTAIAIATLGRAADAQTSADLFGATSLQRVDLWVNSRDWAKLRENFQENEYYPADVTWNGVTVRNAGIRSRGAGSRSGTKPALRVDFDRYAESQTFLGLKSVVLDNLLQDPSGVHEATAMWMFARLHLPAPREVHVVLYVNNAFAGVYTLVESVDKTLLSRVFGSVGDDVQNDGYLYAYNKSIEWRLGYLGDGLDAYKAYFEAKTHESKSNETLYRPIESLVRLINAADSSTLVETVGPYLDLEEFVRFVAVQNFIGENDGFVGEWGMNNFYLYRLEGSDRHVLIAWDDDLSFWANDPAYDVQAHHDTNELMRRVMQVPELRALYFDTLREAAASAAEGASDNTAGALELEIRRQIDLIDAALRADTLRPFSDADIQTAEDLMKRYASSRIGFVQCEVSRLAGVGSCPP